MKHNSTQINEKTFKKFLDESYKGRLSEQELFDAQVTLVELLRLLDEIEQALPQQNVQGQAEGATRLGGLK